MASHVEVIISLDERQPHDEDTEDRSEWESTAEWIQNNIKMRKCSHYIASTITQREGMCQCGYRKEDHDGYAIDRRKQEQSQQDLKWNSERHSAIVPTNAFGEIEFVGFNGNNAKFVRVDSKTNIHMLLMLMKDVWNMKRRNFIISVIGGEENFNMTPRLRDMFQSSLVNLARDRNACIITGGTNIGVAKHVGEAVKYCRSNFGNSSIVAIGIAPWGVIHNKQLLEDKMQFEPIQYTIEDEPIEHERILNPNHTHYILVDNGTQHQFETETTLRAQFELTCNTMQNGGDPIPVVLLVVDGGPHILKRVRNAVSNSIPVVIVKGSGGVADLLAFAVTNAEVSESSDKDDQGNAIRKTTKRLTNIQRRCIYNKMRSTKVCETKDIDYNINQIEACLKFDLISIFDLGGGDQDLSKTIVPAIIKANPTDLMRHLQHALLNDSIDFASKLILIADKECKPDSLDDIMLLAILSNKVDFVELLLDNGVDIKTFLTTEKLLDLYNNEHYLGEVLRYLVQNMRTNNKKTSNTKISMKVVGTVITHLLDDYYLQAYSPNQGTDETADETEDAPFENPFLHLLIWAVLNNRQDMAKLFWRKGLDSIAAALLAQALFSAMSSRLKNASQNLYEKCLQCEANSREFMDLATGVLDRCYRDCVYSTISLLTEHLVHWEAASCIVIARKTDNKTFIAATACQEVFNIMWMGIMTQKNDFPTEEAGESSPLQPISQLHKTKHGDEESMKHFSRAKKIQLFCRAPVVQFALHVISYMAFLCLYIYVLISKFDQNFSVAEFLLIVCMFNIFIHEIWQVIAIRYTLIGITFKASPEDFWMKTDILMTSLFVLGMSLKHTSRMSEAARVILSINLIICFVRLLQMFSLNKELGPKLVMIIRMVRDLTSFFVILLIFIAAYAIASHAILYPNKEITLKSFMDIFRRPYWNIYGELMLDEIEGTKNCTNIVELYRNGTQPRCPKEYEKYLVLVLMGMYMLMCHILLLNLLISIFSNTYKMVQENAAMHWRVQRYRQMQEYLNRKMYIPFIGFIVDIFQIIVSMKTCLCRCKPENRTSGTNVSSDQRFLRTWESNIAQDFFNSKKADVKDIDHSVKATTLRLDQLVSKIDALQEEQHTGTATTENDRLYRDQRMDNLEKMLLWIVDRLNTHQPVAEQESPEKTDERVEGNKKADLESIDHNVKAITLRLDQLFSKIDALEGQQHALPATVGNARLHPSQTDSVAKSESSTVDEPGSVTLDQRMDNRKEEIPWIDDTPEEH